MMTSLVASLVLSSSPGLPKSSIDEVLKSAERARLGTIVGMSFERGKEWDVYVVRNKKIVEFVFRDSDRKQLRSEAQTDPVLKSKLDIRKAIATARKAAKGTVLAAELEHSDDLRQAVWSVELVDGKSRTELYLHANNGKVLEREVISL